MDTNESTKFAEGVVAGLAKGVKVFPTSFDTTIKLRGLLQSETSSLADVTRLLQMDPLLAARIVQAANSAAMNPAGTRITDLRSAVVRLGLNSVRTLALAIAMRQILAYKEMARFARLSDEIIRHSREVAATAFVIAREHSRLSPDLGMFAGLVHEIGLFYLLYRLAQRPDLGLEGAALRDLLDDWHDAVGRAVLAALDVPSEIQAAVALHDAPRQVEAIRELDDLLYVCNLLAVRRGAANDPLGLLAGEDSAGETTIRDFDLFVATLDARQDELLAISALI